MHASWATVKAKPHPQQRGSRAMGAVGEAGVEESAEEGAEEGVLVDLVIPADVLLLLSLDVSRCCVLWMRLGTPSSLCS